jgi:ABC-2 type transport system ATP-binding protein
VTAALETAGLGKRYRRTWALRDCSLAVPAGRVAALVGPNGAGKSTLLQLAVGLLAPTSGGVRVFGEAPHERAATLERLAFVAQDRPLYRGFTVAEMLRFGARLNRRFDQALALERLRRVDVPLERRCGQLSGGQRAQVALSLAVAKRPDLLLLDEPLASLDPLARRALMEGLMEAVAATGLTVVLSSHVIADLEEVCDHLVLLSAARVQLAGDIEALLARHKVLVGPRSAGDAPAGVAPGAVVRASYTERQATLLVQAGPVHDPRWAVRNAGLEELVLAYMGRPDMVALPRPALAAVHREVPA